MGAEYMHMYVEESSCSFSSLNLRRSNHPQNYPGSHILSQSAVVFQNTTTVTSPSQLRAELLTVLNLIPWLQDFVRSMIEFSILGISLV